MEPATVGVKGRAVRPAPASALDLAAVHAKHHAIELTAKARLERI